jgi:DNA-binding CsgD family transcriptional regulator
VETTLEIVGRDEELAAISAFLDASEELPGALLLEGEAGIGKTTLWRKALADARELSYRVMSCTPGEADVQLSFAGLRDLLDDLYDEVAGALPVPQRRALAVALLREEPEGESPQQGAISAGFLGAIRELSRAGPVLVAVDDAQWLDQPSAALLEFAARRLEVEPIALLLTRRVAGEEPAPLGLARTLGARLHRHRLGPFTLGALHRMLQSRLGTSFPRPVLRKLHEASGGNALYALELARALERKGGRVAAGEPLPVPGDLQGLLEERLGRLSEGTREVLTGAASLSAPTSQIIEQALGRSIDEDLREAAGAHVLELQDRRLRFVHPLLTTAALTAVDSIRRRDLHRRFAAVVTDPEERARQLALASEGPDLELAAVLDEAAELARKRGAPSAAAELLEHAQAATPAENQEDWARRALAAAEAHQAAGDEGRGQVLLQEAVARLPLGPTRARALGELAWWKTDLDLCEQAITEAGEDVPLLAQLHYIRGYLCGSLGDYEGALTSARIAAERADESDDGALLAKTLGYLAYVETMTCAGNPDARLAQADELYDGDADIAVYHAPATFRGLCAILADDFDEARRCLESQDELALERGDEYSRELLSVHLAELEVRCGKWLRARAYGQELIDFLDQGGEGLVGRAILRIGRARSEAYLGEIDSARADALAALSEAQALGARLWEAKIRALLGFIELSEESPEAAVGSMEPIGALQEQAGIRDPNVLLFTADWIEALIGAGRLDEAEANLEFFEQRGDDLDRPWILSTGARCRGLLCASRNDLPAGLAALERALVEHERLPMPFERGRTLLALGQVQRRAKRRREARETLQQALAIFEELGARLWAERVRAELARIGGRVPSGGGLTPTERRVAELVAEGRSNKEVAASLFVTVKAVEANLSRIYTKLGIRSRTELAHRFAEESKL